MDGLTLTQLSALVTIWRDGPLSAGDLASREGVKPPSATRVLAALESQGLISRSADPADGRQVTVTVTPEGVARVDQDLQARDAWLAQRLRELDDEDRQLLPRVVMVLQHLAEQ